MAVDDNKLVLGYKSVVYYFSSNLQAFGHDVTDGMYVVEVSHDCESVNCYFIIFISHTPCLLGLVYIF